MRRMLELLRPPVWSVYLMGVTFDSTLTWNQHLERLVSEATVSLYKCRSIYGKFLGVGPSQMMGLYTSIVTPMLTYNALVLYNKSLQSTATNKLSSTQGPV